MEKQNNKTNEKSNRWEKAVIYWKKYYPLIIFIIGASIWLFSEKYVTNDKIKIFIDFSSIVSIIISFVLYFHKLMKLPKSEIEKVNTHNEGRISELLNQTEEKYKLLLAKSSDISENIKQHLSEAKIVFETGIKDYNDIHLSVFKKILNEIEDYPNVNEIYFIDHSDPIQWWSETMTAYMSIIAKWRANGPNRKVFRFFIYSKNELLSPVTVKTLAFHSLLGFNTYIFREDHFEKIFNKLFNNDSVRIKMKELFMWKDSYNNSVNFKTRYNDWDNIVFYQSFWNINEHHKNVRKDLQEIPDFPWKDYLNNDKESKEIKVWFEFIPKNEKSKILSFQFEQLLNELRSNTFCCQFKNDVNKVKTETFGLKIKTSSCDDCEINRDESNRCVSAKERPNTKFEYVNSQNIREILYEYSKIN